MKGPIGFLILAVLLWALYFAGSLIPVRFTPLAATLFVWFLLGASYLALYAVAILAADAYNRLRARFEARRCLKRSMNAWDRIHDRQRDEAIARVGWGLPPLPFSGPPSRESHPFH